jgi:hypothetical protein
LSAKYIVAYFFEISSHLMAFGEILSLCTKDLASGKIFYEFVTL